MIHGTGELTDGIDITPSLREDNLSRLERALDDLDAPRVDGRELQRTSLPANELGCASDLVFR